MLGSCRCNAPARSSCFRTKLTIGCTIHYTGNSTLPIMYTTLFLVYGLPFWVTESEPSICIVNCSYRGCRQHSLCKGLQSTNTGVFSDQVRKVTKHPVGGSLGLGCFSLKVKPKFARVGPPLGTFHISRNISSHPQTSPPSVAKI